MRIFLRFDLHHMDELSKTINDARIAHAHLDAYSVDEGIGSYDPAANGVSFEKWQSAWARVHYFEERIGEHLAHMEDVLAVAWQEALNREDAAKEAMKNPSSAPAKPAYYVEKQQVGGNVLRYWQPSKAMRRRGFKPVRLSDDLTAAYREAEELNAKAKANGAAEAKG
jgi:hypothetical protein